MPASTRMKIGGAFALAALAAVLVPRLEDGSSGSPAVTTLLVTALCIGVLTIGALYLALTGDLGLPKTIALYIIGFNALVVLVKFVLSPEALYERPRTRFVGDFLAVRNILEATVESVEGGRARVRTRGGARFEARDDGGYVAGAAIVVGIRPERITLDGGGGNALPGTLDDEIYLGDRTDWRVGLGGACSRIRQLSASSHYEPTIARKRVFARRGTGWSGLDGMSAGRCPPCPPIQIASKGGIR